MIKIVSAYSHQAGCTLALVNLCNQFNSKGYTCIFYGPDNWHTDKCAHGIFADFTPEAGDHIILNNISLLSVSELSNVNKLIDEFSENSVVNAVIRFAKKLLVSRRSLAYKLYLTRQNDDALHRSLFRISLFAKTHFTNDALKIGFPASCPSFVAPSLCGKLRRKEDKAPRTAGVVGSIKRQNRVAEAVEEALQDGMATVTLFGYMKDPHYYYEKIVPLTLRYPGKIRYAGFIDNRQELYDSVSDVYSSVNRPWSSVRRECAMTNTRFHSPGPQDAEVVMSNDQIFEIWKNELAL